MQTTVALRSRLGVVWTAAILFATVVSPALALHRETPGAVPLGGDKHSWGRSWSRYTAFSSTRNLLGDGSTGRQIFVYSHFNWVCQRGFPEPATAAMCPNPPEPFLIRVTNGPGSPDDPSVTEVFETFEPSHPLAQWVAFDADGAYNGGTGCEASRRQIFLFEVYTHELRQITFGCDGDSTNPTLSFHGGLMAFESTASNIADGPISPAGVKQIYSYFRNDRVIRKVTAGAVDSSFAMVNKVGNRITFQSGANLLGLAPGVLPQQDTGIQQIFWSEYDRRRHIHTLHQLTNGNGDSEHAYNAEDRPYVAFESSATDLPGSFAPGGREIYIARTDTEPVPDLPPVTQLTFQNTMGQCTWPAIEPSNGRVAFICTQDPTPLGTPGNRVYSFDLDEGRLFLVSTASDVTGPIGYNHGQWFVTLVTSADLNGQGTCGRMLWLVDFFAGPQDGNSIIGVRHFVVQPGDAVNGSEGQLVTKDGTLIGDVTAKGSRIDMRFESPDPGVPNPDTRGETIVKIPMGYANLPPIPFPGLGALCIKQTGDGGGILDCDGGKFGSHVSVRQDHFTNDNDPLCTVPGACQETDLSCHNSLLPGPHIVECPRCVTPPPPGGVPLCNWGIFMNQPCESDADCRPNMPECSESNHVPMCNGPMLTEFTGFYGGGGAVLNLPVSIKFSLDPGPDNTYCTEDPGEIFDPYFGARTEAPLLRLTTATATGRIIDPNGIQTGASLGTDLVGGPIDCTRLRAGDLTGAELVASVPFLDMRLPDRPAITDAVFGLRLEAKPNPIDVCGVPCTADADCNDLDACNGIETCAGGFCTAGTPIVCDDGNACNGRETCSPTTGACLSGQPPLCDDGNPCNGAETCDPVLGCVAGTPVECNDPDPCNGIEECDPLTGACLPGRPLCDDLNPCNGTEVCDPVTATCSPGTPIECDDHQICNGLETCDPLTGTCKPGQPPCDNGNRCDGEETCDPVTGACGPPPPNTIPKCDGDLCNPGVCDPKSQQPDPCVYHSLCDDGIDCNGVATCTIEVIPPPAGCISDCEPTLLPRCTPPPVTNLCDDGDPCNGVEACDTVTGRCLAGAPPCDDGNVCDGIETCADGTCAAGTPLNCDDLNPCTDDSCDPVQGCVHTFNVRPCDDGTLCTTDDACSLGVCRGKEVLCSDDDACNGFETCDPATGACVPGVPPVCDDNNPCTNDSCDPAIGCQQIPNADPCDDGSICTTNDQCQGGICTGQPTCSDGDACNGEELCDPGTGACSPAPAPLDCDDGNVCTDDSCQPAFGCVYTNNSMLCDDGDPATTGDQCVNGACVGLAAPGGVVCDPPTCDDGVACTVDTCDPVLGCVNVPSSTGVEGLLCMLQAIEASLNNPPPLAFRSNRVYRKLLRLIHGAERKVQKVIDGANRPRPLLSKTRKALNLFERRIHNAQGHLYIEQNYGDQLLAMAEQAKSILLPLIKPSAQAKLARVDKARLAVLEARELAGSVPSGPECSGD